MKRTLKATTALISVTDKSGLAELAQALVERGIHLIASSGTQAFLAERGIQCEEISAYTASPEILGGRVKTLHPRIHGGILADRDKADHMRTLAEQGTYPVDYVVVNLYPFEERFRAGTPPEQLIEFIDIGGITLLRAAAKNHKHVTVLTNPSQYPGVVAEIREQGATSAATRVRLAAAVFGLTATYDAAIAHFMRDVAGADDLPANLPIGLSKVADVRYGENPHQRGAVYRTAAPSPFTGMTQHQGKQLSFNNYLDMIGAFTLVRDLGPNSVAIIKHNNPCGAAWTGDILTSWQRALKTDSVSAFGGVVAVNGAVSAALAEQMGKLFLEVIVAQRIDEDATPLLAKKKNVRVVTLPESVWGAATGGYMGIWTNGIALVQEEDALFPELDHLETVTTRKPGADELTALRMAWKVAKNVKSNAIVIADGEGTVGIGAGQMSRVDSSHIAVRKAGEAGLEVKGAAAASDAFFPFADGVRALADAGITSLIQPGGSIRDEEVVAAANELGLAMAFTGRRHFRHL